MIINLSPQRRDDTLQVEKLGDILTINGEVFDFSQLEEGDILPQEAINSYLFSSDVTRLDGELIVTLLFPIPANATEEQAFPCPLRNVRDGIVDLYAGGSNK